MTGFVHRAVLFCFFLGLSLQIFLAFNAHKKGKAVLPDPEFGFDARKRIFWRSRTSSVSPSESGSISRSCSVTPSASVQPSQEFIEESGVAMRDPFWPLLLVYGDSLGIAPHDSNKQFACIGLAFAIIMQVPRTHLIPAGDTAHMSRLQLVEKYLALSIESGRILKNELVIYSNAFDSVPIRKPVEGEILKKFVEMAGENPLDVVVVNGECNCYPNGVEFSCRHTDRLYSKPFNYINTGQWMATAGALRRFLQGIQDCYDSGRSWNQDQDVFHNFCYGDFKINAKSRGLRCVVDAKTEVLRTSWERGENCPGFTKQGQITVSASAENMKPCRFDKTRMCPTDPTTHGQPMSIHYNGQDDSIRAGLLQNVQSYTPELWGPKESFNGSFRSGCDNTARITGNKINRKCEVFSSVCGNFLSTPSVLVF